MTESIANISESISALVGRKQLETKSNNPVLKYAFMWQNLERLFAKLSEEDVDDLNYQFITLARSKIELVSRNKN